MWYCKIGTTEALSLPEGADFPMRAAICYAYKQIIGQECEFLFTGWGGQLTEGEREVVESFAASREATQAKGGA